MAVGGLALTRLMFSLTIGLIVALSTFNGPALAAATDFEEIDGRWTGWGVIRLANGKVERIKCVARYDAASALQITQNLRCASQSLRINATTNLTRSGRDLSGDWDETVFSTTGNVTGTVTDGGFELAIAGPGFGALISIAQSSCRQSMSIIPRGLNVDKISIGLSRC